MDAILYIQGLSKSFAIHKKKGRVNGRDNIQVIRNISIKVERGSVTSLIGGNGAGKTTLFNLVNGLLKADEGIIQYHRHNEVYNLQQSLPHQIARLGIGRMFQGPRIFEKLSVLDNLILHFGKFSEEWPFFRLLQRKSLARDLRKDKEDVLDKLASLLGRDHVFYRNYDKTASSLSYAEQRLLSIAGLMLGEADLLLVDEPTSGINIDMHDTLREWIGRIREQGRTVFMIEHNMDFVRNTADTCHYMGGGRIQYSGSPEEVLANAEVQKEYLI